MNKAEQEHIFDHWMKQHQALFFKFVRAYAFTATDREDLFQEIALQVWRSIPNFRQDSAVITWLYRVSMNTAIAWNRKEKKHRDGKESLDTSLPVLKAIPIQDSRLDWLYEEIARLNEIDRAICLLMLDGFKYKEMAALLGISESNVGVKINRIKKSLISKAEQQYQHGI